MGNVFSKITKGRSLIFILAFIWLIFLFVSYFRNADKTEEDIYLLALREARSHFDKDILYRKWVALIGGIYVPVSEYTPSNPYLKIPDKDVKTDNGKNLTLVNPAYMTRLVHELEFKENKIKGHITSLNPIRPANKADSWEAEALRSFQKGKKESHLLVDQNSIKTLRFMAPLITEKSCLKCHAEQGYKIGDIRGE
jgi:hypothetical protein